jgi:uncharacterized peroxidase-related enzyme
VHASYSKVMASIVKGVEPALNPLLAEIEKKSGPSNFFRVMAHRPEVVEPFIGLFKAVMGRGTLERRIKEMTYLAVSYVNECAYCGGHHEKGARAAGLTDAEIHEILTENNQPFSPKEQAALRYARDLTRTADAEDTRDAVHELFSPEQLVELTLVVCMANFTNRFNNGLSVPLES